MYLREGRTGLQHCNIYILSGYPAPGGLVRGPLPICRHTVGLWVGFLGDEAPIGETIEAPIGETICVWTCCNLQLPSAILRVFTKCSSIPEALAGVR